MNVHLVSLGCARTLVDSEVALGSLKTEGYRIVKNVQQADIAVVNTCGFIDEAKRESIEVILELCELKKKGRIRAVVVLGCLAQRFGPELQEELKEVDGIVGTNNFGDLARVLEPIKKRHKVYEVKARPHFLPDSAAPREYLTPAHYAYVKISEGCLNACSYCVIPKMKGPHRSRTIDSILDEIRRVADERPVSEINLIGQDTAAFGYDQDRVFRLPELLRAVDKLGRVPWIRLLYAHPGHVSEALIDAIADSRTICKYVDFPIEHSHDDMLKRMNRGVDRAKMDWGIHTLRKKMPGVAIRTTVIVGFPGETDAEFQDLLDYMKQMRFEKLGAFKFSREEGAKAYELAGQIPEEVKQERFEAVMDLQREISGEIQGSLIGSRIQVLIDEIDKTQKGVYYGRSQADAPEVDGRIIVHASTPLSVGSFAQVEVTGASEYDLVGRV